MDFCLGFWIWSFLAAPEPVPEHLLAHAPAVIVDHMLDSPSEVPDAFPPEVRAPYIDKLSAPARVHAICEQYRATATLDYQHDEADRGSRRIARPVLALWSQTGAVAAWYEPLEVWRTWAVEVRGGPIAAGHFLPEEATRRDGAPPPRVPERDLMMLIRPAADDDWPASWAFQRHIIRAGDTFAWDPGTTKQQARARSIGHPGRVCGR